MAGTGCLFIASPTSYTRITHVLITRCCSKPPTIKNKPKKQTKTPQLLKLVVSGVTEILRLFSTGNNNNNSVEDMLAPSKEKDGLLISGVDDVMDALKEDYDNAYFVTGIFTSSLYADDCLFEDPTIQFRGTSLYARNLQLLVPFFDEASIVLKNIKKGADSEKTCVLAKWSLRTYLKLPWRPLISIEGSTIYDLNDEYRIVRHAESWNVSALEAVCQIFTSGSQDLEIE